MAGTICFLLEEESARVMLAAVLPSLLPVGVGAVYITFEGKQDMHSKIARRLKGWNKPNTVFIIMRDKDSGDCKKIKQELVDLIPHNKRSKTLVRIACHELESFYLGDLKAVGRGLHIRNLASLQSKEKFKNPDKLANASDIMAEVTQIQYRKIAGSRAIAPHLNLEGSNRSHSFNMLISGIKTLLAQLSS